MDEPTRSERIAQRLATATAIARQVMVELAEVLPEVIGREVAEQLSPRRLIRDAAGRIPFLGNILGNAL